MSVLDRLGFTNTHERLDGTSKAVETGNWGGGDIMKSNFWPLAQHDLGQRGVDDLTAGLLVDKLALMPGDTFEITSRTNGGKREILLTLKPRKDPDGEDVDFVKYTPKTGEIVVTRKGGRTTISNAR